MFGYHFAYVLFFVTADRYILLGNHHDAWVFGAVDPLSGSAAVTEITRVFGKMLKEGKAGCFCFVLFFSLVVVSLFVSLAGDFFA